MNQILDIARKHDAVAAIVDDLTLFSQNVIVIEKVFTNVEVLSFDLLLSIRDHILNHFIFQMLITKNLLHSFTSLIIGEAFHQIVVKRNEETRVTRITLTS